MAGLSLKLPALSESAIRVATFEAIARLSAIAFAIEAYRSVHNRPPQTLQELTREFIDRIPADPFDGKPMRYRVLPRGYVIYSIDVDGRDDGGKERPVKTKFKDPNTYDLTFTVER